MGDAGVVAALRKRRHAGAVDVHGPHARHFEQRDLGACADHRVDSRSEIGGEELVELGRAEHVGRAIDLDVEHVPRTDHDECHVGLGGGFRPLLLPALADRERVREPLACAADTSGVVNATPVERTVSDHERLARCRRAG